MVSESEILTGDMMERGGRTAVRSLYRQLKSPSTINRIY